MSLTVEALRKQGVSANHMDTVIRDNLNRIDKEIQSMPPHFGMNRFEIELPQYFPSLKGLEKSDQQRVVYSAIIDSLEKRGFTVGIIIEKLKTVLLVSYMHEVGQDQRQAMDDIIKRCMMRTPGAPQYPKNGAA